MNSPRTRLYRDKENAKLMGVCSGIADYTGIDPLWVRLGMIASFPLGIFMFTVPLYLLAGILLNKRPPHLYKDEQEQKYWQSVRQNPKRSTREIRGRFRDIDRRLAEVESFYVSNNQRLTAEIERLR